MKTQASYPLIGQFVESQLAQRRLSLRSAAKGIGISCSYLSAVVRGLKNPGVETVNQIADHFQVPRTHLYELMGWMGLQDQDQTREEGLMALFRELTGDEDFVRLARLYAGMSPQRKRLTAQIVFVCAKE